MWNRLFSNSGTNSSSYPVTDARTYSRTHTRTNQFVHQLDEYDQHHHWLLLGQLQNVHYLVRDDQGWL